MCFGIHNEKYIGSHTNEIEFSLDPAIESKLFVKVCFHVSFFYFDDFKSARINTVFIS